jgi:hypothetical protein
LRAVGEPLANGSERLQTVGYSCEEPELLFGKAELS